MTESQSQSRYSSQLRVTAEVVNTLHRDVFALTIAIDEQTYVVAQFGATMVKRVITTVAKMRQEAAEDYNDEDFERREDQIKAKR